LATVCLALPLSAAPLLLAWMACNYIGLARFRLTTMTGWQMTQPTYNMFDRVDPQDRVLGDMLVRSFRFRNRGGKIVREHFWDAFDEIVDRREELPLVSVKDQPRPKLLTWFRSLASEESRRYTYEFLLGANVRPFTKGDPNDVGDYVGKVAWRLIRKNPLMWIDNAMYSFFHDTYHFNFNTGSPEEIHDPRSLDGGSVVRNEVLWKFLVRLNDVQAPFLLITYLVTLGFALFGPWIMLRGHDVVTNTAVVALAWGSLATMLAYCFFAAFSSRYSVPQIGIFTICSTYAVDRVMIFVAARAEGTEPSSTTSSNSTLDPTSVSR